MSARGCEVTLVAHEVGSPGGMERQLAELTSGLLERGHDVTVIARRCELPPHPRMRWIHVPGPTRPFALAYPWFFLAGSLLLRRHRRGLVHTTGAVVFNRADASTVHFCHRAFVRRSGRTSRARRRTAAHRVNSWVGTRLSLLAERWCYRPARTAHIVGVSPGVAREVEREFPRMAGRVSVIPNGVDLQEFAGDEVARGRIRERLDLDPRELVAVFVGGEWERKGLRFVIEALARADDWRLMVVGEGDRALYTQAAAAAGVVDRVRFVGEAAPVSPFYSAADGFVLPTAYEAFPLVSLEAAAAGLPLLITSVNGVEDILVEGGNGWFIERDAGVIADRLTRLAADPGLRRSMGLAAREAAAGFGWPQMIDRYTQRYEQLGAARP
jgi:UDP-glucose:(heptosyl)LPS alpha-1,3-glucosyltransferase